MEQELNAVLTGSDSRIEGVVSPINYNSAHAYEFKSFDGSLHLVIAKDGEGQWQRIAGTDPYFAGWVDELAEQLNFITPAQ